MEPDKTVIELRRRAERKTVLYDQLFERAKRRIKTNRELALVGVKNHAEHERIELLYDQEESDASDDVKRWADMVVRAQEHSQIDEKSGLYREAAFAEWYAQAVSRLKPNQIAVLVAFDLDGFKVLNTTIGHTAADGILREVGEAIQSAIRADDAGCRIGGDEFMVLLSHMPEETDVRAALSRLCTRIGAIVWGQKQQQLSASLGAVIVRAADAPYFNESRAAADLGSNVSKSLGRRRLTLIDGEQYGTYRLMDGVVEGQSTIICSYDGAGLVADLEATPEQCYHEVMTGVQRVIEEITTALGDQLAERLHWLYSVRTLEELSLTKLAGVLYKCRQKKF